MLTHFEVTLRLCVATCVHAQMIDKLMNWYMCITPVSPIASTNMPHGVTCGYETQHHTPGMTLTSMSPGIKSENRRMCGEEQNWRFIDNYTSPPGMNVLRWYPHVKRIIFEINWKRQATKTCFVYWDRSMVSAYSNNLNSVWPLKNANYCLVTFVEILTISYQVCSISTTSIGHQTKYVVSLTVSMSLIKQRTQRSQRYVVLLRKRACWILCLQISSLTTSPVLCLPSHGSQILPWMREWCRSRWSMQLSDHF